MTRTKPGHWLGLSLLVLFLGTVAARGELVRSFKVNLALREILCSRVSHALQPLRAAELLESNPRPTLDEARPLLAPLQTLAAQHPNPQIDRLLGVLLASLGYPVEAEVHLRRVESDPLALTTLAIVHAQQNRPDDVHAALQRVPDSASVLEANGEAAYWASQYEQARRFLEMALTVGELPERDKPRVYQRLSWLHEIGSRREKAVQYARLWVATVPCDIDASIMLAGLYLRDGRAEDAFLVLRRAETLGAWNHPLFPVQMGRVYDLRGDLEQAIPLYREAVAKNPDDPYSHWYLGQALYRYGGYEEASPHLEFAAQSTYPALRQSARELLDRIEEDAK